MIKRVVDFLKGKKKDEQRTMEIKRHTEPPRPKYKRLKATNPHYAKAKAIDVTYRYLSNV